MKSPGDSMNTTPGNSEHFTVPKGIVDYVDNLATSINSSARYLEQNEDGSTFIQDLSNPRKLSKQGQAWAHLVFTLEKVKSNTEIKEALVKALKEGAISAEDLKEMFGFLVEPDQKPKP